MTEIPSVTVIIPTYNRGERILNVLKSLEGQLYKNFEVIIVNDGSSDNTKEILDARIPDFDLSVKVIHQENSGRSKVRNRGAKEAKDGLLIFMDDDMRHNESAIGLHVKHHQKLPHTILVGNAMEDARLATTDMQRYKAYLSRTWSKGYASKHMPLDKTNLHLTAANFSIDKSLFFKIGGFDEALTDIEDYDLGMRAFVEGIPVYYDPDIIGWHDDFISCRSYINRRRQYLRSQKKLQAIKPELYSTFHRSQSEPPAKIKTWIYKCISGNFLVRLADADKLVFLPEPIRYRVYSAIIYANSIFPE